MPPPVFFKDVGKKTNDLLTKDWPSKVEFEGTLTAPEYQVKTKFARENDQSVNGSLNPILKFEDFGTTLSTTLHSSKEIAVEVTLKDRLAKGFTWLLKAKSPQFDSTDKVSLSTEATYVMDKASFQLVSDIVNPKGATVKASVNGRVLPTTTAGAEAEFSIASAPQNKKFDVAIVHTDKNDNEFTFYRRAGATTVCGISHWHKQGKDGIPDTVVGTNIAFDTKKEKALPDLECGVRYDPGTYSFKTKFGTHGRLGFAFQWNVASFVKSTVGLDVNSVDTADHKVGIKLEMNV